MLNLFRKQSLSGWPAFIWNVRGSIVNCIKIRNTRNFGSHLKKLGFYLAHLLVCTLATNSTKPIKFWLLINHLIKHSKTSFPHLLLLSTNVISRGRFNRCYKIHYMAFNEIFFLRSAVFWSCQIINYLRGENIFIMREESFRGDCE